MSEYTSPESNCERRLAGIERKEMLKHACDYCLHRDPGSVAGRHPCKVFGRSYPKCTEDDRAPAFDPDVAEVDRRRN